MKVSELIYRLQQIPHDPDLVVWDPEVGWVWPKLSVEDIGDGVQLVKMEPA